jgi:hypothetical protein
MESDVGMRGEEVPDRLRLVCIHAFLGTSPQDTIGIQPERQFPQRHIGSPARGPDTHAGSSLYGHVKSFVTYYHESRTHLSLGKDSPESRAVQPPELGRIVAIPQVGGLHTGTNGAQPGTSGADSRAQRGQV